MRGGSAQLLMHSEGCNAPRRHAVCDGQSLRAQTLNCSLTRGFPEQRDAPPLANASVV